MSEAVKVAKQIDFNRAVRNPFAKIAKAAKNNGGTLPAEISKQMMKEAIRELHDAGNPLQVSQNAMGLMEKSITNYQSEIVESEMNNSCVD